MKTVSKIFIIVPFLTLLVCPLSFAEEFRMKSGEMVSGELMSYEDGTFRVKSKFGILSIEAGDLAAIGVNTEEGIVDIVLGTPTQSKRDRITGTIEYVREGELKIKTEYDYVVVNPMNKATGIFLIEAAEGEAARTSPQEEDKSLSMNMGDIAVQVKSLRVQDKNLLVTVTYTNNGKGAVYMTFGDPQEQKLYIIDDVGNEYTYVKSTDGMVRGDKSPEYTSEFMKLPVGRQVDVLYTFASSSEEAQKGSMFSVFLEHYLVPEGAENVREGQTHGVSFTDIKPQ